MHRGWNGRTAKRSFPKGSFGFWGRSPQGFGVCGHWGFQDLMNIKCQKFSNTFLDQSFLPQNFFVEYLRKGIILIL